MAMQQHYVEFLSPGSFFHETTSKPVDAWNVEAAVAMAHEIVERHEARPFGFRFKTRGRGDADMDSKEIASSGVYYLGGEIQTLAEVEARNDDKDRILLANMRGNGYDRIIVNTNSWKVTQPFTDKDTRLDVTLAPVADRVSP